MPQMCSQGAWAIGTCTGPIVGGALATSSRWRWIFYGMLPLAGVGLISVPLMVRLQGRSSSLQAQVRRVDFIGGFLFIPSAALFLVAISRGGVQVPWSSSWTVGPLVGGGLGLVITASWEKFAAPHPFLPPSVFHHKSAYCIYAAAFAQGVLVSLALPQRLREAPRY